MNSELLVSRRNAILSLMASLPTVSALAQSDPYPNKPIRLMIGYGPGGGSDIAGRIVGDAISKQMGQPVVIENRPGAGGNVAAGVVAKAIPDGYNLVVLDQGPHVYGDSMFKGLSFDPFKDIVPVATLSRASFILVGGPALPASISNIKQALDYALANPGALAIANSGLGTGHHLTVELMKQRANVDIRSIPYRSGAAAVQDTMSGQVAMAISGKSSTDQLIRAGRIRPIAVTTKARWPDYPNVPTVAEVIPGFEALTWNGIFATTGVPPDILAKLNSEVNKALRSPDVVKRFDELGFEPLPLSLEELHRLIVAERAIWPPLIRKLNINIG